MLSLDWPHEWFSCEDRSRMKDLLQRARVVVRISNLKIPRVFTTSVVSLNVPNSGLCTNTTTLTEAMWMLLIPGTGNREQGAGSREQGTGNGERGTGNGSLGTSVQRQPA